LKVRRGEQNHRPQKKEKKQVDLPSGSGFTNSSRKEVKVFSSASSFKRIPEEEIGGEERCCGIRANRDKISQQNLPRAISSAIMTSYSGSICWN